MAVQLDTMKNTMINNSWLITRNMSQSYIGSAMPPFTTLHHPLRDTSANASYARHEQSSPVGEYVGRINALSARVHR